MIKSQFLTKNVLLVAIFTILVFSPMTGEAATSVSTVPFDTLSISEKITYLSALVAQVQTDLNRANYNDYYRYNNFNNNSYNVNDYRYNYSFNNEPYRYNNNDYRYSYSDVVVMPGNRTSNSNSNDVDVETTSATNIEDDEADLRGRLDLEGERSAEVWFEYGEDDDDLDERTNKKTISDSRGDVQTFIINIDDLDDNQRYYFQAVAEDRSGDKTYGDIRSFTTDRNNSSNNRGDFELSVSDTRIEDGDEVEVDWEVPSRDRSSNNWIGLYERGDSNTRYINRRQLDSDTNGTEYFVIRDEGSYEFRLFLDDSYDDEITSQRIEVY